MISISQELNESSILSRLIELIEKMPVAEQVALSEELEERLLKFRRRHFRKPLRTIIKYGIQGNVFRDFIQNISIGGLFVETQMPLRVGEGISISFVTPESIDEQVKIDGEIVRVNPQGVGVAFKTLNTEEQKSIKSYLDNL
jgi:Tfp pilus assembly protein PilZ